jgi:hypothetical protein
MALGWLSVVQHVPWTDVIANAPKVADGAKKLWGAVSKKPGASGPVSGRDLRSGEEGGGRISGAELQARLVAAEAAAAELHGQMLASSELIKTLAEQNARLIEHVERQRRQLRWVAGLAAASLVLSAVAVVLLTTAHGAA